MAPLDEENYGEMRAGLLAKDPIYRKKFINCVRGALGAYARVILRDDKMAAEATKQACLAVIKDPSCLPPTWKLARVEVFRIARLKALVIKERAEADE